MWRPVREVVCCGVVVMGVLMHDSAAAERLESDVMFSRFGRSDVAFVGTVQAVRSVSRGSVTALCPDGVWGPVPASDVVIVVDSVLYGSLESNDVTVTTHVGIKPEFVPRIPVGSRVISACNRICSDSWRLWGEVELLPAPGAQYVDPSVVMGPRTIGRDPLSSQSMIRLMDDIRREGCNNFDSVLNVSAGIGVARVRAVRAEEGGAKLVVECDSAQALLGEFPLSNVTMEFERPSWCWSGNLLNAHILIPMATRVGETSKFQLRSCPREWIVRNRFVVRLGIAEEFVPYAVSRGPTGWRVLRLHDTTGEN